MDKNFSWVIASIALFAWSLLSIVFWAKWASKRASPDLIDEIGNALPPFAIISLLVAFAIVPASSPVSQVFMWMHHLSFILLFVFLTVAELLQFAAYSKVKQGDSDGVVKCYSLLRASTLIVPAPIALTTFLTGLRLMYQKPPDTIQPPGQEVSISAMWLQLIVISFGLFFFDGILGFTPAVRRINRNVIVNRPTTWNSVQSANDTILFFVHYASWIGVLLIAVIHPLNRTVISGPLEWMEGKIAALQQLVDAKSAAWAEVIAAILLYMLVGALVFGARKLGDTIRRKKEGWEGVS